MEIHLMGRTIIVVTSFASLSSVRTVTSHCNSDNKRILLLISVSLLCRRVFLEDVNGLRVKILLLWPVFEFSKILGILTIILTILINFLVIFSQYLNILSIFRFFSNFAQFLDFFLEIFSIFQTIFWFFYKKLS